MPLALLSGEEVVAVAAAAEVDELAALPVQRAVVPAAQPRRARARARRARRRRQPARRVCPTAPY